MLVRTHKKMQRELLLVVLPGDSKCRRIFEITGLTKMLRVVPSLEAAIRYEGVAA
jgi:hypothetical protein